MKKKKINNGLRSFSNDFVNEKELEANLKEQISKEISNNRKK